MIRKIPLKDEIRDIILNSQFKQVGSDLYLVLRGQLDRKTYTEVNKFLELMDGKWNRKAKAHIFSDTTEEELRKIYASDLAIEKDGFFPTPKNVVEQIISLVSDFSDNRSILEPSAGEGNIADVLKEKGYTNIICVERNPRRQNILRTKGYSVHLVDDCLNYTGQHHIILMNPPFENSQDVDHILHLYNKCLLEGGELISVMSNGITFREDKKYKILRELNPEIYPLPSGSFKESGTMVETVIIKLRK